MNVLPSPFTLCTVILPPIVSALPQPRAAHAARRSVALPLERSEYPFLSFGAYTHARVPYGERIGAQRVVAVLIFRYCYLHFSALFVVLHGVARKIRKGVQNLFAVGNYNAVFKSPRIQGNPQPHLDALRLYVVVDLF